MENGKQIENLHNLRIIAFFGHNQLDTAVKCSDYRPIAHIIANMYITYVSEKNFTTSYSWLIFKKIVKDEYDGFITVIDNNKLKTFANFTNYYYNRVNMQMRRKIEIDQLAPGAK